MAEMNAEEALDTPLDPTFGKTPEEIQMMLDESLDEMLSEERYANMGWYFFVHTCISCYIVYLCV